MKYFILTVLFVSSLFCDTKEVELSKVTKDILPFVIKKYMLEKPPYSFKLLPREFTIDGNYAQLEAVMVDGNGKLVETQYVVDVVFVLSLEKRDSKWDVVYDLSRTDVPSDKELQEIKKSFPKSFPVQLLSSFWKDLFSTVEDRD